MRYDLTANGRLERAILPEKKEKIRRAGRTLSPASPLYLSGGVLFVLLFFFGLFGGMFLPSPLGTLIAGGEPILGGSLFGVLLEVIRGSIPFPGADPAKGLAGILPLLLYGMTVLLALGALLTLALAAFAFTHPAKARKICFLSGGLTVLLYGGLLFCGLLGTRKAFDPSAFTALGGAAGLLGVFAVAHRGGTGFLRTLLLVSSLASWGAFAASPLDSALCGLGGTLSTGEIFLLVLLAADTLNLLFSLLRLAGRKGTLFDVFRFSVGTGAALALAAAYLTAGNTFFGFLGTYSALFLLAPPLMGLLFAVLAHVRAVHGRKKRTGDADPL